MFLMIMKLNLLSLHRFTRAVDKTRRGAADQWVKSGDWELGDYMIEICCKALLKV